jgi:hypothetical protein
MQNREPSALYSIDLRLEWSDSGLQMTGRERIPEYGGHKAQSNHDYAADLGIYAEYTRTDGAALHRGDQEAAEELSSRAQEYYMEAAEKTNAVASQTPEPARV